MKKIILVFGLLLMLLASCNTIYNPNSGKAYNVTFISNNEILELDLEKYLAGSVTKLPVLDDTETEQFIGWYKNPNYTGDKVESISMETYGDLTFYAKWEKLPELEIKLTSISTNQTSLKVLNGTLLEDAIQNIIVYKNYSNGTKKEASVSEYTYRCDNYDSQKDGDYKLIITLETYKTEVTITIYSNIVPPTNTLEHALEQIDNFQYTYKYSDNDTSGDYSYESDYEYDNGSIKTIYEYEGTIYTEFLIYNEQQDSYTFYGQEDDGSYYSVPESDENFDYYLIYFDFIDLSVINAAYYTESNGVYQVKKEYLTGQADGILSGTIEGETYNSLEITVTNNTLSKIVITSTVDSVDYGTYDSKYEIILSNFGKASVNAPTISDEPVVTLTSISTNYAQINVLNGTSLDAVMENIIVYKNYSNGTNEQAISAEYTYRCENYDSYTNGSYQVVITLDGFETIVTVTISNNTTPPTSEITRPTGDITLLDDVSKSMGVTRGMPSIGNSKALIIPVCFTDYLAEPTIKKDLETVFFGTSEETGWESLSSYYAKASYGKLNITGSVLDVFNTGKSSTYYSNLYKNGQDADYEIIKAALEHFDSQINYADYDSDQDGYIDAIYLIYTCPIDYESSDSMWWAYTYEYMTDDYEYYDGVEADYYFFAGYDFMFETPACGKQLKYNAETFIHETGHMLGLDDYYDYDDTKGPSGGIGGGDMMDYNVGDHNPFSKMILGWVRPYVVSNTSGTVKLSSFGSSGDCLLICKNWNGTYFDEYYVVDYYTPDGLNAFEAGSSGLFSTSGIRIYHVDAKLKTSEVYSIWEVYASNNTDTTHKLISLVQASGSNSIENDNAYSSNSDLFKVGTSFTNAKWYNNSLCNFTLTFEKVENNQAVVSITY